MKVRILTPAREEFLEAIDFYADETPGLALDFLEEFERALGLIASNPRIGSPFEDDTRRKLLRRFPFQIIYDARPDEILVIAVAHQRRRPDHWRRRR